MKVFTIGYGAFKGKDAKAEFIKVLKENKVKTLVDVRLHPEKAYVGTWVKAKTPGKGINGWLPPEDINYEWVEELGNKFLDDPEWKAKFTEYMKKNGNALFKQLEKFNQPICLMCAEAKVEECHRKLIADYLKEHHSCTVKHL